MAGARPGPSPSPGVLRDPREHHLSGHDDRAARRRSSPRVRGWHADEFFLGYSPERIDPGNATHGLVNTPKVVSGSTPDGLAVVDAFFSALVDQTVPVGSCAEAELVKLLENTFRHVNIALVNELAMFARDLDVDVWRAIDAAATKPFGYMKFTPGPGCRRPLPADRPELPGVAGEAASGPHVPVRRVGQRRQRAHARLRARPGDGDAEPRAQGGQRQPGAAARPGVQEGDERLAREPVGPRRRPADGERRRGAVLRPVHPRGERPAC